MRKSMTVIALVAILMGAMSVSAYARDQGGRRGGQWGHTFSGTAWGAAFSGTARHPGQAFSGTTRRPGHAYSGVRAPAVRVAPPRHFARGARVGVFIGLPLIAPLIYPAPGYYSPPPVYIEQAPAPAYWYFCPELNAYYPYVQECPGGWQTVLPQPPG